MSARFLNCDQLRKIVQDWYRSETWSPEIESAFQGKLKRARTQGSEYLYIQAVTLATKEPGAALKLVEQYFASGKTFRMGAAFWVQATAYQVLSQYDNAIEAYRHALLWESGHPNQLTRSYLELPYLLAMMERAEDFGEAIAILHDPRHQLVLPLDEFMYGVTMALIHQKRNDFKQARPYAVQALRAAEKDRSPFWKHPTLGLVGTSYEEVKSRMRRIVEVDIAP